MKSLEKFVYMWSKRDGSVKFCVSGNLVGLDICGTKFRVCRLLMKLFVGIWDVCSNNIEVSNKDNFAVVYLI